MGNVYRDAIALLNERGWRQNVRKGPDGDMCVVGAISTLLCKTAYHLDYMDPVLDIPSRIAQEQFPKRTPLSGLWPALVTLNDDPSTTKDDIVVILEKSAVALEEQI